MILEPKHTVAAYRCPSCWNMTFGIADALRLTGDLIKLRCECHESEMIFKNLPDGKVRVTVPCFLCGREHTFVISKNLLFSKELFVYQCSNTGLELCFFGDEQKVREAADAASKNIDEMLKHAEEEEFGEDDDDELSSREDQLRRASFDIGLIHYVLGELKEEKGIICSCGTDGDYIFDDITDPFDDVYSHVKVSCKKCGCMRNIYCGPSMSTEEFLTADKLFLEKETDE